MTRKQKQALAWCVFSEVGNLLEFWDEKVESEPELKNVDLEEARLQISKWMSKIPCESWHVQFVDFDKPV